MGWLTWMHENNPPGSLSKVLVKIERVRVLSSSLKVWKLPRSIISEIISELSSFGTVVVLRIQNASQHTLSLIVGPPMMIQLSRSSLNTQKRSLLPEE